MEILGYFVDADTAPGPSTVFVAVETPDEVFSYSPIGQHSQMDLAYLDICQRITKAEYLQHANGFYTPPEYLA